MTECTNRKQAYISPRRQGPYYVKYPCGGESMLMNRDEAEALAEVFGGEVCKAKPVYKRFGLFGQFRKLMGWG